MTDSMRDRIDRVIYDAWNLEKGNEIPYLSPEAREAVIDALLAAFPILAGVTDEAVEAGALALVRHVEGGRPARPVSAHARELARVVLEAVIGKEQVDERG